MVSGGSPRSSPNTLRGGFPFQENKQGRHTPDSIEVRQFAMCSAYDIRRDRTVLEFFGHRAQPTAFCIVTALKQWIGVGRAKYDPRGSDCLPTMQHPLGAGGTC
jgi:hypothetical protein